MCGIIAEVAMKLKLYCLITNQLFQSRFDIHENNYNGVIVILLVILIVSNDNKHVRYTIYSA